jgi:hypothetical protein
VVVVWVLVVIVVLVVLSLTGGWLGYRVAPSAGYTTDEERDDWRKFGREWSPVGVLTYWLYGRALSPLFRRIGRFVVRLRRLLSVTVRLGGRFSS